VTIGAAAFTFAFIAFLALKVTVGIRVSQDEEIEGLDIGEHGMEAYTGLQLPGSIPATDYAPPLAATPIAVTRTATLGA
jgi:hypothetical protein